MFDLLINSIRGDPCTTRLAGFYFALAAYVAHDPSGNAGNRAWSPDTPCKTLTTQQETVP
ncbi:MAG: hypothetical protein ABFS24_13675 [Pseudomonadota bacterium]